MRVLICPQRFGGTLTSVQAAEAIAEGWRRSAPTDELSLAPLSDGGAGFLDVIAAALPEAVAVASTVCDPLGRPVPAMILLAYEAGVRTAYVEAAQAAGLHLLRGVERDPLVAGSYGVGELVAMALAEGARRIVVGVGDLATNDGGAGVLAALGAGPREALARGGAALEDLGADDLSGLLGVRARFDGVELELATHEDLPLLGLQGTSASMAGARGAGPEEAQRLEFALGRFREVAERWCPPPTDLISGAPRRWDRAPGAGAGGGVGYVLHLLGGTRVTGARRSFVAWGMDDLLAASELVVTGEGRLDWRSLRGSVMAEVAEAAARRGLPVVALNGTVDVGRRDAMTMGLSGNYAVAEGADDEAQAIADPVGTLTERAARIARTWSPGR